MLLLKVGNKLRNETIVKQNNVGQGTLGFQTILSAIKVRTITAIQYSLDSKFRFKLASVGMTDDQRLSMEASILAVS